MRIHPVLVMLVLSAAAWSRGAAQGSETVPYPEGYRAWTHVKSMVLFEDHPLADPFQGIHHVYANAAALEGLMAGSYGDGAILVFDLLEAARAEGALAEGPRTRIDVMHRDAARYASTDGWGYVTFVGDSRSERLDQNVETACYACHTSMADRSSVFSQWRP